MTTTCPNGHESEWADYCSTCGELLDPAAGAAANPTAAVSASTPATAAPAAAPAESATGPTCGNCGVSRHEHDVFCESCGYDFASGSLPEGATEAEQSESEAQPVHAKVSVDAEFFAASVGDVDLTLPDPLPDVQIVPLPGIRILIGRQSTSRGIFPELDIRALTDDPAVSSRHAMLERDQQGEWSLTDLGSTNGTFLTPAADDAIKAGVALPVAAGSTIYLGAWTRIDIAETNA